LFARTFAGSDEDWKKFLFNGYLADSHQSRLKQKVNAAFVVKKSGDSWITADNEQEHWQQS